MGKVKYNEYKPSKTLWQDEIPGHWDEAELRLLFTENKTKNIGLIENNLLSLSYGKLKRKNINTATGLVPASFEGYQIVNEGYIVLRFTDLQNDKKSLRVAYATERGIITNAYVGVKPRPCIFSKYYYYLLHFLDKIKYYYNLGAGVRQSLSYGEFCREIVLIPPRTEQIAIARFLDYKTGLIDRFIRKKKQLIKLLNEQKAAIINHAVTKGINPNAAMKDSGIEWLGEIPSHWDVKKLKYSVRLNQHEQFDDEISSNNKIALENIESKTGRILSTDSNPFLGIGTIFKPGDVLFGKLRPYLAKVVSPQLEGSCVNEILVLTPDSSVWRSDFLKYRLLASDVISVVNNSTYGAKMPRANWDFIGTLKISRPSLSEQDEIVTMIEHQNRTTDVAITGIEKEITLAEEYRTTLIAEAVTGKIDVREYKIPETVNEEIYEDIEEELSIAAEDEAEYETQEKE